METPTASAADKITTPRYDAFISYRHVEPDRKWAIWLHTALETYRVPKALVEKGVAPRLQRCFRDEEELPASANLNNQIEQALEQSRFLIVICSPRTPQSLWVNKEVERFRELDRNDRILALLIEGEPSDSFPRALREIRRTVVDSQGMAREQIEEVEPLAADVRARSNESERHLARMARLRLLACILGVRFDDLRQREAERRARRLAVLSAAAVVLMLVMAGLAIAALVQRNEANRQRGIAQENERQAVTARRQAQKRLAESLVSQADVYTSTARWSEAARDIDEAFTTFTAAGERVFPAQLALWQLQLSAPSALNPLFAPRTFGRGAVALSADGKLAAAMTEDQSLAIWDLPTGKVVEMLGKEGGFAFDAAFLEDNKRLVSAHKDGALRVWDLEHAKVLRTQKGHAGPVICLALIADGHRIASGGADGAIGLTNVDAAEIQFLARDKAPVLSIGASAASNVIVTGHLDGTIQLWNLPTRQPKLIGNTGKPVTGVAVSPEGGRVLSVSNGETVMWDVAAQSHERLSQPTSKTGALFETKDVQAKAAFNRNGDRVLWSSGSGAVVQNVRSLSAPIGLAGHLDVIESLAFSGDGALALAGSRDKQLLIWPTLSDRHSRKLQELSNVYSVALSRTGSLALTGGAAGSASLWDTFTGRLLRRFQAGPGHLIAVALSPDASKALFGGDDKIVRLVDLLTGEVIRTFSGHTDGINGLAFSPDGSRVVTASKDHTVKLWSLSTGTVERTYAAHTAEAIGVAFAPDGRQFVSCGADAKVILWNTNSDKPASVFSGHQNRVRSVAFARDGKHFASGSDDGTLRFWDTSSGTPLLTINADPVAVCGVSISPDGQVLFSAGASNSLRIFDSASGREWRSIKGFKEPVWSVALSDDGLLCLAGSNDGTALLSDFSNVVNEPEIEPRLKTAVANLATRADDPQALKTMGEWYALRGVWPWASEFLERAQKGGAQISPLMLGRCRWQNGDTPGAIAEFQKSLAAKEADETYLKLCLQTLSSGGSN